jgi:hypothetical protein
MAKFLKLRVGSVTRVISAENVITTDHPTNTTTTITYNHAQAAFVVLTLTHTPETARSVEAAIIDAILTVQSGSRRPQVFAEVSLPTGITVSAIAFA